MLKRGLISLVVSTMCVVTACGGGGNGSTSAGSGSNGGGGGNSPLSLKVVDGLSGDKHVIYNQQQLPIVVKLNQELSGNTTVNLTLKDAPNAVQLDHNQVVLNTKDNQAKVYLSAGSLTDISQFQVLANIESSSLMLHQLHLLQQMHHMYLEYLNLTHQV